MKLKTNITADVKFIESIENINVAKILVKNYGASCIEAGKDYNDETDTGIRLTSSQLLKFIVGLIEENDKLKRNLNLK